MAEETWYQKAYRPACGFAVAIGSVIGVLFVCTITLIAVINGDNAALGNIAGLSANIALILGVPGTAVGIAAWHRGVQQVKETEGNTAMQVAQTAAASEKKEN